MVQIDHSLAEQPHEGIVLWARAAELAKRQEVLGEFRFVEEGFDVVVLGEEVGAALWVLDPCAEEGEVLF